MELDDALLDDPARLADADTAGVLRAAAMAGAQFRSGVEQAVESGLTTRLEIDRPRALVLIARGGISYAVSHLISALLTPDCPVPIVHAERVPNWVGPLDVIYAHTDDPGDAELATSLERAARRGATVVLSAPDEGPVAASVAGEGVLVAPRQEVASGRTFAHALVVGLLTVSTLGLLDVDVDALADELDAEAERDHPGHESFVNPAKLLALGLADRTPLLWGLDPLATAVAGFAAHAFATEAAVVCDVADYREAVSRTALHRAAVAGLNGQDTFADPYESSGPPARLRVELLALRSGSAEAAVRASAEHALGSPDVIDAVDEFAADEPTRATVLVLRFTLAAAYLGLATGSIGEAGRTSAV